MPNVIAVGNVVKSYNLDSLENLSDLGIMPWRTGGTQRNASELASSVAFLFRAVNLRASALADVPWSIARANDDAVLWESTTSVPDALSQFADLEELLFRTEAALCLTSTAYWFKQRNRVRVTGLQWLDPTSTQPWWELTGGIGWFNRSATDGLTRLAVDDVVYIWNRGLSEIEPATPPAQAAMSAAQALYSTNAFVRAFFERGGIKATLLTVEGMASKEERAKLKSWWSRSMAGMRNAFAAEVISAAVKPVVIGEGISELSNTALTAEQREDIATALGVPHSMLMSNAANFATASADRLNFYEATILPECNSIARQINRQLFAPMGLRFAWRPQAMGIFQENEEQRASAVAAYVSAGMPLSVAVRMLGIDLPEGVEPRDLDPVTVVQTMDAGAGTVGDTQAPQVMGYHIEQGVVSRNEARAVLGLPPVDATQDERVRGLRTQLDLMIAAQSAGIPPDVAARMVGLEMPQESFAPPPAPDAAGKTIEAAQFKRWMKKRPNADLCDFEAHYLSPSELEELAGAKAGRKPFADGADAERQALEEKHEALLATALTTWRKRAVSGGSVTAESFEAALEESKGVLRDAIYAVLFDAAMLGTEAGRYQVESAITGRKAIVSTAWDTANAAVIHWLIGDGTAGIGAYLDTVTDGVMRVTIAQAAPLVAAWAENGQPMSALVDALTQTGFSAVRARRIATSEVTRAFAKGNKEAWRASGVVKKRVWVTSADEHTCPVCGALAGEQRDLDEPFTAEIDDPPGHPECRCFNQPVID